VGGARGGDEIGMLNYLITRIALKENLRGWYGNYRFRVK